MGLDKEYLFYFGGDQESRGVGEVFVIQFGRMRKSYLEVVGEEEKEKVRFCVIGILLVY